MIHTYHVIFGVIFELFLVQNFKTKVLTATKKNLLLECLPATSSCPKTGKKEQKKSTSQPKKKGLWLRW